MRRRYKSFSSYGITKEESKKLMRLATLPKNEPLVRLAASETKEGLGEVLYISLTKNLGFEGTDRICYIPLYNPNDFYGHRRYALYLFKIFLKCRAILCEADGKPDTEETQSNAERTPRKSKTELLKRNSMS